MLDEFLAKYRVAQLTVCRNASWTWSVRTAQSTLGAGMLSLHRLAPTFGAVTREEMADLADMFATIELTLQSTFHYDKLNYFALMMTDALAHMHFFPRYQTEREFAGHRWVDATWPNLPPLGGNRELSTPEILDAITNELKNHLP